MLIVPKNLARLLDVTAREEGRYAMQSVLLQADGDGYRAVACDGKHLACVHGPCLKPEDFRAFQGGKELSEAAHSLRGAPGGAPFLLCPAGDWKRLLALGGKQCPGVAVALAENELRAAAGTETLLVRALEGRFPDYTRVFPKGPPRARVRVTPALLVNLLQAARQVADADRQWAELLFYGPALPLGVHTKNARGQLFDGICMPLT